MRTEVIATKENHQLKPWCINMRIYIVSTEDLFSRELALTIT
jgi:hypothetical protein